MKILYNGFCDLTVWRAKLTDSRSPACDLKLDKSLKTNFPLITTAWIFWDRAYNRCILWPNVTRYKSTGSPKKRWVVCMNDDLMNSCVTDVLCQYRGACKKAYCTDAKIIGNRQIRREKRITLRKTPSLSLYFKNTNN